MQRSAFVSTILACILQALGYSESCTQGDTGGFEVGAILSVPFLLIPIARLLSSPGQSAKVSCGSYLPSVVSSDDSFIPSSRMLFGAGGQDHGVYLRDRMPAESAFLHLRIPASSSADNNLMTPANKFASTRVHHLLTMELRGKLASWEEGIRPSRLARPNGFCPFQGRKQL